MVRDEQPERPALLRAHHGQAAEVEPGPDRRNRPGLRESALGVPAAGHALPGLPRRYARGGDLHHLPRRRGSARSRALAGHRKQPRRQCEPLAGRGMDPHQRRGHEPAGRTCHALTLRHDERLGRSAGSALAAARQRLRAALRALPRDRGLAAVHRHGPARGPAEPVHRHPQRPGPVPLPALQPLRGRPPLLQPVPGPQPLQHLQALAGHRGRGLHRVGPGGRRRRSGGHAHLVRRRQLRAAPRPHGLHPHARTPAPRGTSSSAPDPRGSPKRSWSASPGRIPSPPRSRSRRIPARPRTCTVDASSSRGTTTRSVPSSSARPGGTRSA